MPRPTGNPQAGVQEAAPEAVDSRPETVEQAVPNRKEAASAPVKRRFHCPGGGLDLLFRLPVEATPPIAGLPYQSTGRPARWIKFVMAPVKGEGSYYSTADPEEIEFITHYEVDGIPWYLDGVKGVIRDATMEGRANLANFKANFEAYEAMVLEGRAPMNTTNIVGGVLYAGQTVSPRPVSLMSPVSAPVGPGTDWNPVLTK